MLVVWRLRYSLWRRLKAWLKGRSEGKRSLPPSSDREQAPVEVASRHSDGSTYDRRILGDCNDFVQSAFRVGEANERRWRNKQQGLHEGLRSDALALRRSEMTLQGVRAQLRRMGSPDISLGTFGYALILIAIALGEAAFNMVAFEVFGEAKLFTLLMVLGVVIVLPLMAHVVGMKWCQINSTNYLRSSIVIASAIIIMLGALWEINKIRLDYLGASNVGLAGTLPTEAYFLINILIFAGAVYASYLAHDSKRCGPKLLATCGPNLGVSKNSKGASTQSTSQSKPASATGNQTSSVFAVRSDFWWALARN